MIPARTRCVGAILTICLAPPTSLWLFAADGYGDAPATPAPQSIPSTAPASSPVAAGGDRQQLREGTLVTGLTGRFVLIGRRWAFLPERPPVESAAAGVPELMEARSLTTYSETRSSGRTSVTIESSSIRESTPPAPPAASQPPARIPQLLVVENLMLQRVAEAIRATPSDDRWTVSGELTEFFDENGLLLRTVQRAAMKEQ